MTETEILKSLGIDKASLLGEGVEASVYALDDHRVLRIHKPGAATTEQLVLLAQFYKSLDQSQVSFKTPDILSVTEIGGRLLTIDRRVYGQEFDEALGHLRGKARRRAWLSYIQAAEQIQLLHPPYDFFGELLTEKPLRTPDWPTFIMNRLNRDYQTEKALFDKAFPHMQKILDFMQTEVDIVADTKASKLVHGDYYVLNVLIDDQQSVCGVMDFNHLTLAGDPRMDLAAAMIFCFEGDGNTQAEDSKFLLDYLIKHYSPFIKRVIHLYRLYFAIHFASYCKESDPATFKWAIQSLQEHFAGTYTY